MNYCKMDALLIVLKNVIIFVLLAVPGFILVKSKLVSDETSGVLSKVIVLIGMPFLIVTSVAKITFNAQSLLIIGLSALIGIAYHFFLIYASRFVAGNKLGEKNIGISRFCIIFSNNGFLGIPLAMAIFGSASLVLTSVIVINIITNVLMQTTGVSIVSGQKQKLSFKILLNPLLIAFVIGVIINLSGFIKIVPETVTYSTYLSNIVTPLSMIVLGMQLGRADVKKMFSTAKTYYIASMKLLVVPIIIVAVLLIVNIFVNIPRELVLGVFIAFAMPTAGLASAYATMHDGDVENAVYYTIGSTILATASIPVLFYILQLFI